MQTTLLGNLKSIFWQYRARYLKAFLMIALSNGLLIVNPLIFRHALKDPDLTQHTSTLFYWAGILFLVAFTAAFFKYWMRITFITISREVEQNVRSKIFSRVQSQSQAFFDHHGIGELLSRLTNDVSAYRDLVGPGIMYPLFFLTLSVPGFIALSVISLHLTAIALVPLLVLPILNYFLHKHMYHSSKEVQKSLGVMSNMVQEHFSGIRVEKGYAIENSLSRIFSKLCKNFAALSVRFSYLQSMIFPLLNIFNRIITILLVLVSGLIILKGWGHLSAADFVSFMWIQSYIYFPILMIGWVLPVYERGRAAYERLVEIYQEPIEVKDVAQSDIQISKNSDIYIKNLTFIYPGATTPTLNNLNLHIKHGSFIGLTGPVGAGKSTLFKLINRDYEIAPGMIFIGKHDIHDYPLQALREELITVEQTTFLFSKSVGENIRFGKENASQKELEKVSAYADLATTIARFPLQYDTPIGERGVTLSGGQKQRIALARAFLVDRSFLLLDDIFSAVDTETEKHIFQSIKKHFKGKTVVLITHRTSILDQMDEVVYIHNGRVQEQGKPQTLIKQKGLYAALSELQNISKEHNL